MQSPSWSLRTQAFQVTFLRFSASANTALSLRCTSAHARNPLHVGSGWEENPDTRWLPTKQRQTSAHLPVIPHSAHHEGFLSVPEQLCVPQNKTLCSKRVEKKFTFPPLHVICHGVTHSSRCADTGPRNTALTLPHAFLRASNSFLHSRRHKGPSCPAFLSSPYTLTGWEPFCPAMCKQLPNFPNSPRDTARVLPDWARRGGRERELHFTVIFLSMTQSQTKYSASCYFRGGEEVFTEILGFF